MSETATLGGSTASGPQGGLGGVTADSLRDALSDPLLDNGGGGLGSGVLRDAAGAATSGAGRPLPNLSRIQSAFGPFDVSGVTAHTDAAAAAGTASVGARGMAVGGHVALGPAATLHTEAHEAAHAVQQSSGVHLDTGDGAAEAHADAVADRVVRGDSAVDLLSQVAEPGPVGAGGSSVQLDLMSTEELATYGAAGFALFGKTSFGHVVHRLERYHAAKTPEDKRTHALKLIEHIQAWEKSDSRNTLDPTKKAADEKKADGLKKLKLQATTEAEFIRMKSDQVQPEANPRLHTIQVGEQSVMPRMVASTAPLFGDNEPSMDGIKQGALGDCWLLAGLGALVNKDPGYIKGMMTDNGTSVTVRLFDDKGPKFIKVNKEVPKVAVPDPSSSSGGTRDVDTFAKGNLWVQMIEKAVAVHMQSYKSTEGSKGNIAFSVLTGSGGTKLTNTADMRRKPWPGGGNSDGGKTEDVMCKKVAVQALGDTDAATWWAFATKYRPQLTSAQTLEAVQKVATDHAEEIDASIVQTLGAFLKTQNLLPGRMGSGNYSRSQMDAWSFITKGLSSGALMSAGTNASIGDSEGSGGSGEAKVKGMAGGHQYTLLATKTDERGRNWIQVRNPWGRYSREYDEAEDGTLTAKAKGGEGDNGQSWIELSDFCAMFGNDVYKK